jgi:hypothetical protein
MDDRKSLTLYDGMDGMLENTFMNVKNRSKTITAELVIPKGEANGVILAQGGRFGGWSLYMKDGKPVAVMLCAVLICFTSLSFAEKTDVVILKKGGRIIGEIRKMERSRLLRRQAELPRT